MTTTPTFRLTIFNHKGGVGKTTLTVNIAAALAEMGKRVLLVDSDPQCNLTSYLLNDEIVDDLLNHSETTAGRTVWSAIRPIREGTGTFEMARPYEPGIKNLFLVPGDIRLSKFENRLHDLWSDCFKQYPTGYRGTTALSSLVGAYIKTHKIDYVFYDTGPNIGPLNRIILLDCDAFIIPAACDLFSVRGLKTLGATLKEWLVQWQTLVSLAPDRTYLLRGTPRLLGHIPQRFRTYSGAMASVSRSFYAKFEHRIAQDVIAEIRGVVPGLMSGARSSQKLGEVKDFASLVQVSQEEGRPLWETGYGDAALHNQAHQCFTQIAKRIVVSTAGEV